MMTIWDGNYRGTAWDFGFEALIEHPYGYNHVCWGQAGRWVYDYAKWGHCWRIKDDFIFLRNWDMVRL